MKSLVKTAHIEGHAPHLVTIESGFLRGFSGVQMIGNASELCRDGKERARAALELMGFHLPQKRLVINMAPADLRKDGNQFDLPLAVSLALLMSEKPPALDPLRFLFVAELGLHGELRPVKGVVSFALLAVQAGMEGIVIARENLSVARTVESLCQRDFGVKIFAFDKLQDVVEWLFTNEGITALHSDEKETAEDEDDGPTFDDMLLTEEQQRLAVCCGAGEHSILLQGSPGTGKSMFAARIPSILPPMNQAEHLQALQIQSRIAERLPRALLQGRPPFRSPHHSSSAAALIGTGETPGELSLAHGGVLFLDELPEFRRDLLEALREPLETGILHISRAAHRVAWDARVLLLAACNPCPCGWLGSPRQQCLCASQKINAYRMRLSGPVLDRIDLHYHMPENKGMAQDLLLKLALQGMGQTEQMREWVRKTREFSRQRNLVFGASTNRGLKAKDLLAALGRNKQELASLLQKFIPPHASQRAVIRSLRVARTLADMGERDSVTGEDLHQAWEWQLDAVRLKQGVVHFGPEQASRSLERPRIQ